MITDATEVGKFYVNSFMKVVTTQMNPRMAIQLVTLINSTPVEKELYAMAEKIRTQLFHMGLLYKLDVKPIILENENGNESTQLGSPAPNSYDDSGECDAGASKAA